MPGLMLDHALKVNFLKLMFACNESPFYRTSTTLVKHFSLVFIVTMALKRVASIETTGINAKEVVEKALVNLPICGHSTIYRKEVNTNMATSRATITKGGNLVQFHGKRKVANIIEGE